MGNNHAPVIIAGGSIAGLALANMLELAGIDFLVLEKYKKIAPDLGASLALFRNAARILDQIGCWDKVEELNNFEDLYENILGWHKDGRCFMHQTGASQHARRRYGYQMMFIDRRQLVQILYDHIKDTSRILPNEGITSVQTTPGGIKVKTASGSTFTGDILVGADGIHSVVRKEMWRVAGEQQPGILPKSELDGEYISYTLPKRDVLTIAIEVVTQWRCMYGISTPNPNFPAASTDLSQNDRSSHLTAIGPGGKIYWFLSEKLENEHCGLYEKVPRYTLEDEKRVAAAHANDVVAGTVRFGELYQTRTISTLQALPEMTLSQWHFDRMVLIGDAAHKFNPIGGQGGASAIEDAAVLTNELVRLRKSTTKSDPLPTEKITAAFDKFQQQRHSRATFMEDDSRTTQRVLGMDGRFRKFMAEYVAPHNSEDADVKRMGRRFVPAARLDFVDVPHRPRSIPFDDERPAKVWEEPWLVTFLLIGAAAALLFGATKFVTPPGVAPSQSLQMRLTGFPALDEVLNMIVTVFVPHVNWTDLGLTIQSAYLLFMIFPILVVWYIEGYRYGSRHRTSLLKWPLLCGIAMQVFGIGIALPAYCFFGIWTTRNASYTASVGPRVNPSFARAILPATVVGYLLPTVAIYASAFAGTAQLPHVLSAWLSTPILVSVLVNAFAKLDRQGSSTPGHPKWAIYYRDDLKALGRTYGVTFALSTLFHLTLVAWTALSTDPGVFIARIIVPSHNYVATSSDLVASSFMFFKWDLIFAAASMLFYGAYNMYELRKRGMITTRELGGALAGLGVAQVVIGPGAALIALWMWRERKMLPGDISELDRVKT